MSAIGFTSEGIAWGSAAAGAMSSSAIASGGGVAAGSAVAVMQSVGASGLSTGATVAWSTAGALPGLVASTVIQAGRNHQNEFRVAPLM